MITLRIPLRLDLIGQTSETMLTKVRSRPRLCRIVPERFIDILARISVYTVQSSNSVHTRLITQVLPPKTSLPNTLMMIVLDWTKPWTFVDQLELWMKWIEDWSKSDNSRELEVAREEGREKRMSVLYLRLAPTNRYEITSTVSLPTLHRTNR